MIAETTNNKQFLSNMRILIVDKTAGLESSHERHRAIAERPSVDLHVLGPRRWIENGREVVWNPPEDCPYAAHIGAMFFKDYYARAGYSAGLNRALASSQPDVIQLLEEPWSISAWQTVMAAVVYAPTARILFYTWETIYRPWTYPSRASWLYGMIDKILHHRSTAAVCATQSAKAVLLRKGFSKPILTASYGIPSFFFNDNTQDLIPNRPFTAGYVGRILYMKGVDLLIEAAAALPDLHLIIAGSGEDQGTMQERCRELGIADRIKWRPPMPERQIPEFLRQMDVFVLPSRTTEGWSEQLGRAAIEAMACGVPTIGSSSGAIPEAIGGAGLIFKENSLQSLVEKIVRLRDCAPARNRLRHAGRERAIQCFTWDRFAGDLCSFYRTLL